MKLKVTLAPEVKAKLRAKENATEQLAFYAQPWFADKISQLAKANKRTVSRLLLEMVEYAVEKIEEGEAEIEPTPSAMHPVPANSPLSWANVPSKRSKKQRQLDGSDGAVEQTLSRIGADVWPDSTVAAEQARKNNLRGKGYVVPDDEE